MHPIDQALVNVMVTRTLPCRDCTPSSMSRLSRSTFSEPSQSNFVMFQKRRFD